MRKNLKKCEKLVRAKVFYKHHFLLRNTFNFKGALYPRCQRANYQAMVWKKLLVNMQSLPSSALHGWKEKEGKFVPVMSMYKAAPAAILEVSQGQIAMHGTLRL